MGGHSVMDDRCKVLISSKQNLFRQICINGWIVVLRKRLVFVQLPAMEYKYFSVMYGLVHMDILMYD